MSGVNLSGENLMIVQGGGGTAVLNASLASVIAEAIAQPSVGRVLGAKHGALGLSRGEIVDLSGLGVEALELLRGSPGAELGSSRFQPEEEDMQRMVEHLRWLRVGYLVFMGGNGTMRGAEVLAGRCREAGLAVRTMGVPKTIDNDLVMTDRTPGYGSAARYVAQSTRDLGMDLRSLPQPVTILETMGRSVGWLAGASVLGKSDADDAPHLVCVPEVAFEDAPFLGAVDGIVARQGWAVVVVAEGLRRADGRPVYELGDASQADPLRRPMIGGVGQHLAGMVARELKLRCRSERPGLLGRMSRALVSVQDEMDAALVGRAAVQALVAGESDQMVALLPLAEDGGPGYRLVPLAEVAGVERPIPAEWLDGGPLAVTEKFCEYVRPLAGELAAYAPAMLPGVVPVVIPEMGSAKEQR